MNGWSWLRLRLRCPARGLRSLLAIGESKLHALYGGERKHVDAGRGHKETGHKWAQICPVSSHVVQGQCVIGLRIIVLDGFQAPFPPVVAKRLLLSALTAAIA